MNCKLIQTTLIALLILPTFCKGQGIRRIFEEGDKKKYQMILEEWHNGKLNSLTKSVCQLTTVKDSGYYYEEVKWFSKVQISEKDSVVQDSLAQKVKPYKIALEHGGKLEIPKIDVPAMTQPIQDFTTFFVAISPQLGITQLNKAGDIYNIPDYIKGDFANGSFILKGEDCFRVSLKYESLINNVLTIITTFEPPNEKCLNYLLPEMDTAVIKNTLNNFQMVMPSNDKFNIQYGVEEFKIESHLNSLTGSFESATMVNSLILKLKINCNSNYQNCSFEMPFSIVRKIKVVRLN